MDKDEYFADVWKYRKDKDYAKIWRFRLLVSGIILFLAFIIVQIFCMMSEYEKEKGIEIWSGLVDWYEFQPNSLFASEARNRYGAAATSVMLENEAKVYTEYLAKWANESDVDVLRLELKGFYGKDNIRVYSYLNQSSYEMAWDEFTLPLSEGRWFEDAEDEIICFKGDKYEIGDVIKIDEKDGSFFLATVVGKTRYPHLIRNTLPVKSGVHNSLYTQEDDLECFLLNPMSGHNEKSDLISYNTTLVRTDSEKFIKENGEYGVFTSVEQSLKNDKAVYVLPVIEMCLAILFFVLFSGIIIYMQEDRWMLLWIWVGGILGGFAGTLFYYDARYKAVIVLALCSSLSLIWWIIHRSMGKKTIGDKAEIEVILVQKDEDMEDAEI